MHRSLIFFALYCSTIVSARDFATLKNADSSASIPQGQTRLRGASRGAAAPSVAEKKTKNAMKKKSMTKKQTASQATTIKDTHTEDDNEQKEKPGFDFVVAGFPKCGTTTLLKAFSAHEETDMATTEQCAIAAPMQADQRVFRSLDNTLAKLQSSSGGENTKRSFKCPTAMYNYKSITRMEKHSPDAKFVIGMRHPVEMLQSFYNYRVTEIKERGLDQPIPSFAKVLHSHRPWKGVSVEATRFELFLMQLGKTSMTADEMEDLIGQEYDLAIHPNRAGVFLYTTDQLEDTNDQRSDAFRSELQQFLGLTKPIAPFGHENKNHQAHDHAESIDICDAQWAKVRAKLVAQGAQTARWLREQLLHHKDVVVANEAHFLESISKWSTDPCQATAAAASATA